MGTLSSARSYRKTMISSEIKSPQAREINWWDGLYSRSISGKGRDGARSVRQHYWRYEVTGTVLDTALQRSFLYPAEGGEYIRVVTCIQMAPNVSNLLIVTVLGSLLLQ